MRNVKIATAAAAIIASVIAAGPARAGKCSNGNDIYGSTVTSMQASIDDCLKGGNGAAYRRGGATQVILQGPPTKAAIAKKLYLQSECAADLRAPASVKSCGR